MVERDTGAEHFDISLQQVYIGFKTLAQTYGKAPSEGMLMPVNARTYNRDIPSPSDHDNPYHISGKYFGPSSGTIEIFYRNDEKATQLTLLQASPGRIFVKSFILYEVRHLKRGGYSLHRLRDEGFGPDINALKEMINAASEIESGKREAYVPSHKVRNLDNTQERIKLRRRLALSLALEHAQKIKDGKEQRKKYKRNNHKSTTG